MKPFDYSHAKQLIGKVVTSKENTCVKIITGVSESGVTISDDFAYFSDLLEEFVFIDGSPCGVEEEYNLTFIEVLQTAQNGDSFIGENLSIIFNFNKNCFFHVNDTYVMLTENVLKDNIKNYEY